MPPEANRGSWIGRRADELGITEDRFGAYLHAENACPGWILLMLFDKFGPEFEAKVRGTTLLPNDNADRRAQAEKLRSLADDIEHGETRVVPMAGKVKS